MAGSDTSDVLVKFTTKLEQFRVPPAAISVPAALNRAGLSQVINHILGAAATTEFEFFLASTQARELDARRQAASLSGDEDFAPVARLLLRSSLKKYTRDLGLTTEDVLILEYCPSLEPPSAGPSGQVTEWVGALACSESLLVAGMYDGTLALLPISSLHSSPSSNLTSLLSRPFNAHAGAVTGLCCMDSQDGASTTCVSAGADGVVNVWTAPAAAKSSKPSPLRLSAVATLESTGEPCGSLACDPTGERVACGDLSGQVYVWDMAAGANEQAEKMQEDEGRGSGAGMSSKRKRESVVGSYGGTGGLQLPRRKAKLQLAELHEEATQVSAIAWLGAGTLASGGWDHSIVISDMESGGTTSVTLRTGKVVTSLACSPQGSVLASGHPDGVVRVWDPRGRGGAVGTGSSTAVLGLRSSLIVPPPPAPPIPATLGTTGSTWVSSLQWCPGNAHLLAGTAYTGAVMLWDVRAPGVPLHSSPSPHDDKALACAWVVGGQHGGDKDVDTWTIVSGGADKRLRSARVNLPQLSMAE